MQTAGLLALISFSTRRADNPGGAQLAQQLARIAPNEPNVVRLKQVSEHKKNPKR